MQKTSDINVVETRALRGFGDGLIGVVLAGYLINVGFGARQIGVITTTSYYSNSRSGCRFSPPP